MLRKDLMMLKGISQHKAQEDFTQGAIILCGVGGQVKKDARTVATAEGCSSC